MDKEYSNLEVQMSDEDKELIIEAFVRRKLDPAAYVQYLDELSQGRSIEEALLVAVINECVLEALRNKIQEMEQIEET